ncbi:MAG: carboxylating nicotinate-nucleotide diphosphorylase [Fibrobacterota bacterium]
MAGKNFNIKAALPILRLALAEDLGPGDVTSEALPRKKRASAVIRAKAPGIICGLPLLPVILRELGGPTTVRLMARDGNRVRAGQKLALLTGRAHVLLSAERTMLNFLGLLSGIATLTRQYADAVRGTDARIYDTRKTPPGLRYLAKYAVRMGGGQNHRMGLYDMALIKDNHIAELGITEAVKRVHQRRPGLIVEVEAEKLSQVLEALESNADIIMLDNMSCAEMKKAVTVIRKRSKKVRVEASGGVDLRSVRAIARTGVDRISVGAITHSVKNLDVSMEMK